MAALRLTMPHISPTMPHFLALEHFRASLKVHAFAKKKILA